MHRKKTIVVLDDNPSMTTLIQEIVNLDDGFEVKEVISHKESFLEKASTLDCDVALIDISLKGLEDGLDVLKELKRRQAVFPSVVLSAHNEEMYAPKCLEAGALGYLNKAHVVPDLIKCLNSVLRGDSYVSGPEGNAILTHSRRF